MSYKIYERNLTFSPVEQVLYNRGVASEEVMEKLIYPDDSSVHSPYLLDNIENAAKAILTEIVLGHKIYVQVD